MLSRLAERHAERGTWTISVAGLAPALIAWGCGPTEYGAFELDRVPVLQAEQDLRIGAIDDPIYSLAEISALLVDSDENMYTLHRRPAQIRRWTHDGIAAGDIGGTGQGPGEFTSPSAIGLHGDTLWVLDMGNSRISLFGPEGALRGQVGVRLDLGTEELALRGINPPRPAGFLADGSVRGVPPGFSGDIIEGLLTELQHVRMDPDGVVLDTLAVQPVGRANVLGVHFGDGGIYGPQPFSDAMELTVSPDGSGLVLLDRNAASTPAPAEFHVTRVDLAGDTAWARSFQYAPVPIPRSQVDSVVQATAEEFFAFAGERTGIPLARWETLVAEATYDPRHFTPVDRVGIGVDGTVWLSMNSRDPEDHTWVMLTPDGEPVARVSLPANVEWMTANRTTIWGVERDELAVPYIVRYRLHP